MSAVPDEAAVRAHLEAEYAGVFAPGEVDRHIAGYVAPDAARPLLDLVGELAGRRLLDVGCGYGSFVMLARDAGSDAVGIELAGFEVDYARARLAESAPSADPSEVFVQGDALRLPFADASFDLVTFWNVIEHVPSYRAALAEAARVLRPGGRVIVLAPNYAAPRREAHYHVPWLPLMPRPLAQRYLSLLGRDPKFFETSIHYCTNSGVRRALRRLGLRITDRRAERLADPALISNPRVRRVVGALSSVGLGAAAPALARAIAANPIAATISVEAVKA